ncbi:MAG: Uma2 family endonuclease [Crocosphaera sp.]
MLLTQTKKIDSIVLYNHDPPPDLALEIDLSSKSINPFPIYARLEVNEIWCYDSGELKIYQLEGDTYLQKETTSIFPNLDIT